MTPWKNLTENDACDNFIRDYFNATLIVNSKCMMKAFNPQKNTTRL